MRISKVYIDDSYVASQWSYVATKHYISYIIKIWLYYNMTRHHQMQCVFNFKKISIILRHQEWLNCLYKNACWSDMLFFNLNIYVTPPGALCLFNFKHHNFILFYVVVPCNMTFGCDYRHIFLYWLDDIIIILSST